MQYIRPSELVNIIIGSLYSLINISPFSPPSAPGNHLSTNKNAQHKSSELSFIQGLTEAYSLGDSLSDSSEELL